MYNVLLLENIHPVAEERLRKKGFNVRRITKGFDEDELVSMLQGVHLLGIRSRTTITSRVIEHSPDLLAIGAFCIGTNQIDVGTATIHGVPVFNAPFSNTRSVAELVIAEAVILLRKVFKKMVLAHSGGWDKSSSGAHEIRGKKLGIVGYGNIGSQVSALAEAMGMDVYFYDVVDKLNIGNATKLHDLDALLSTVDVLTIHVDGREGNTNLIGERELSLLKKGAIVINLSRGFVVDIEALANALKSGHIAGAAVDVFPAEPKSDDERFFSPLQGIDNVLLTPHIGGSTEEAQYDIGVTVADKLASYALLGNTLGAVNIPNVALPESNATHRLLHIHNNMPGVLSLINGIMARHNVNIASQMLRTDVQTGYVITDVDSEYNPDLVQELQRIEHTIRVRTVS